MSKTTHTASRKIWTIWKSSIYLIFTLTMFRGKNYLTKTSEGLEVNTLEYLNTLEKLDFSSVEELENASYTYVCGDNSYNYEDKRILTQTMQRDLFMRKNPHWRGYNYAVAIYLHNWGDVRGNYSLAWIYKTNENCFQYLVRICDGRHIARYYNNTRDFKKSEIEETKKELK